MRTINPERGLQLKIIQKDAFMLGSRICRFIWKLIKYLTSTWTTSQYLMHFYWEKRCVLRHRFQRGVIWIQKTTVWWSGASDHTLWNQQYQDWEHWWVYNKSNYSEYVLSSSLSIYFTLIAIVLKDCDAACLHNCWFLLL